MKNTELFLLENIELPLKGGSNANQIFFPDLQDLRNARIYGFWAFFDEIIGVSINNTPIIDKSVLQNTYLNLQNRKGYSVVNNMPLSFFQEFLGGGSSGKLWMNKFYGAVINWPKSYVWIANTAVIPADDVVFSFAINYINPDIITLNEGKPGSNEQTTKRRV